jgi:hypothetical protein
MESGVPDTYLLSKTSVPGWQIIQPIALEFMVDDDDTIILSESIFCNHGAGDTFDEALQAYIESLTTYYEILEEGISDEYSENEKYLDFMREYIVRCP